MLSGRENAPTIVEALSLGAVNYVVKPDDPEGLGEIALEAAIKQAMEKTPARLRSHRAAPSGQRRPGAGVLLLGAERHDAQHRGHGRSRGGQRCHRADSRRKRRRQGTRGARHSRPIAAAHASRSSRSTAPRSPTICSKASCSATRRAPSPAPRRLRVGKFEHADDGTLMLDEIGEMKAGLQGKLLHVLQDGEFSRLGSNKRVSATCASSRRPTAISKRCCRGRSSARICTTVSGSSRSSCRRCASAATRFLRLFDFFIGKYANDTTGTQPRCPPTCAKRMRALQLAGQHPRARKRHETLRHSSGRGAGAVDRG